MPGQTEERARGPRWVQVAIAVLILYSCVTVALETMPELAAYQPFFRVSEAVVVILFTIEYAVFWYLSNDRRRYPFRFWSLLDLAAICPFYLTLGVDLRHIRMFRLIRMIRVLKLARYGDAMDTVWKAVKRVSHALQLTITMALMIIVVSASLLYYAEREAQPEAFSSIPESLWWSVVTLTTIGYGDVYPKTVAGRVIASGIMLLGIGFIAVPTGLVSSAMTDVLREQRDAKRNDPTP